MTKHPLHGLWMHEDHELSAHIGSRVCQRTTLHEWPLSAVQRIVCDDGRRLIYKSQYGPTVEAEFYACATSPILPCAETFWQSNGHTCMLIEFIDAPLVQDLGLQGEAVVKAGREILTQIGQITGNPPCCLDISDAQKWLMVVDGTIRDLTRLVEDRRFTKVSTDTVASLSGYARCRAVLSAVARDTGIIHGDAKGDNVFVTPDGYRVIDWQRTMKGQRGVDMAAFLHGHKIDPAEFVDAGTVGVFYFLHVWWLTQCKMRWIPDARSYDGAIVALEERLRKALP